MPTSSLPPNLLLLIIELCIMNKQILFKSGSGGNTGYRIPTCIRLPSGRIIVFCEARTDSIEDYGHISVLAKISDDNGATFSSPVTVSDNGIDTIGNPSPVYDKCTGRLFLFLNWNAAGGGEELILKGLAKRKVLVTHSDDDGLTWSEPRDITSCVTDEDFTWHAAGPCHGIQTSSGRLMIPVNHAELISDTRSSTPYISGTIYSDDHGLTWHRGSDVCEYSNECTLCELANGTIYINMRSYLGHNKRLTARSRDLGRTWYDISEDAILTEPVCQGSCISLPGTDTVYFINPASVERSNLTLRKSIDGAKTWQSSLVVHSGPSAYSDIALIDENTVFAVYECGDKYRYERIECSVLSTDDII